MMESFDPFEDRTARDIRNGMSSALIADMGAPGGRQVSLTAQRWLDGQLPAVYRNYIRQRQERYHQVIRQIGLSKLNHPRDQAILLWNMGLFFEMHELLETIWKGSGEPERTALKGLIQAAGVYVHSQRGKMAAAHGLAGRAHRNLKAAAEALNFIINLRELLDALGQPTLPPPILRRKLGPVTKR
jgi:hypothetical protein